MGDLNFDFNEAVEKIKNRVIGKYINECKNPEKDENNQYIIPSLETIIERAVDDYFEESYGEMSEDVLKKYEGIFDKLSEKIFQQLDLDEIHESMKPLPHDYWGLSEHQRNS